MQTFTGRQFWPTDPRADEIFIEDIAHALSMMCRYAGHCLRFYSVAEHCVHLARNAVVQDKLWALLHDAAEAYVVDVPRPLKSSLPGYHDIEDRVMQCVIERFGLAGNEMPASVKLLDNRILVDERQQIMAPCAKDWNLPWRPLGIPVQCWAPKIAEAEFLACFRSLEHHR